MIIGITGAKNSGKSTFAKYLQVYLPGHEIVSLADPMKEVVKQVYGFSDEQLWGSSSRREEVHPYWGFSARRALELLGTEWGRKLHRDTWIAKVAELNNVIIPDVRYSNEAEYIYEKGGIVVGLTRNRVPWWRKYFEHKSNRGVPTRSMDIVIDNRKFGLDDLERSARELVWT